MKFEFEILIGMNLFRFSGEAETPADFFQQVSPFMEIPRVGPDGQDDLVVKYRVTKTGNYKYFSVVSPSAGMEFEMGQLKEPKGHLFPKGWRKIQYGQHAEEEERPEPEERKPEPAAPAKSLEALATPKPADNKTAGYSHDYPNASQRSYQTLCDRIKTIESLGVNEAQWRMRFGIEGPLYALDQAIVDHLIRRADSAIDVTRKARQQKAS